MRVFIPLQRHPGFRVSEILFLNMFSPVLFEIHPRILRYWTEAH